MKFQLLLLVAATILVLQSCASPVVQSVPQYRVELPRLREQAEQDANAPLPPPVALLPDEPTSGVLRAELQVTPDKTTAWKDLPTTLTSPYDQPPQALSLKEVILETLANNRRIKIQGYSYRIADYQVPVSKGIYDLIASSSLEYTRTETQTGFSILDNSPTVSRSRQRSGLLGLSQLLPTGATLEPTYSVVRQSDGIYAEQSALSLTQPLLRGFGWNVTNAGIQIARLERQGSAADLQTQIEEQLTTALNTYWELIGTIEFYKVQVLTYSAALDLLRVNRAKFQAQVLAMPDLLQAEAAAESRREQVIRARQAIRNLEDQLKRLIFLQAGAPRWPVQLRPTQPIGWRPVALNEEEAIALGLARRAELDRARSNLGQTNVNLTVARNNLLPSLNLFGEVSANSLGEGFDEGFREMEKGKFTSYVAGLEFSFPLQNRTARYRYRQAEARQGRSGENLRDVQDQVTQEVRQAARDLRTGRERILATQSAVISEQAKLDSEIQRFDVGLSTTYRIVQFQADLASAQSEHIQAIVAYNKAGVALERARGTLLPALGIHVSGAPVAPY